jgi:hypothetical protein
VGIVVDEDIDLKSDKIRKKAHFFEFSERWDEWYTQDDLGRLAPYGTLSEDPQDKIYSLQVNHRRKNAGRIL